MNMFSRPVVESPPVVVEPHELIPLSQLALDMPEPAEGWRVFLQSRNIEVLRDDVGRRSISKSDVRLLLEEQAAAEEQARRKRREQEQAAVVADELRRSRIWSGIPASAHEGLSPAAAMLGADYERRPRRKNPIEEALSDSTLTYHPYGVEQEAG
jgi:hypothetical protein